MPGGNDVVARGEIGKRKAAVVVSDSKVAGFEDDEIALHPRMNVAFDENNFFAIVGIGKGRSAGGLHLVSFAIDFGEGMNVVGEGIAVGNADFLAGAQGQNVGGVVTAVLIEDRWRQGCCGVVVVAGGDMYDDIAEGVVWTGDDVFGVQQIGGVHVDALRLFGKIERLESRRCASKSDFAVDGGVVQRTAEKEAGSDNENKESYGDFCPTHQTASQTK